MNNYITIRELSKLMHVSVHQIRYFEEKKIFFPAYVDTNHYRMYGMDEIYQLSHILLLRKLNVPVQQIKECLLSYSADDYYGLLTDSLQDVQSQIDSLIHMKQFIQSILQEQQEWISQSQQDQRIPIYVMKKIPVRHFTTWITIQPNESLHARALYQHRTEQPALFETDFHYLYSSDQVAVCVPSSNAISDSFVEKGLYLTRSFTVTSEENIAQEIHHLNEHAFKAAYVLVDPIILIEKSYLSMLGTDQLHYEIQARIEVTHPESKERNQS
ncbi:DNA-binding transcriptional MerR regulator [Paenibacillus pabuli]|uniref:DNA-binding transcriptional MerR regulator n=1 Tax=Paenibacillus pabuli TaxID=1472 RepID=A0ABX9BSE0_9BACL|nr:MerR family transcriptional regulator [Paenibacillus pabuli]RAJ03102.1 DNA-binding transcriptional MerR regulator [Paenibacillus pabuli]